MVPRHGSDMIPNVFPDIATLHELADDLDRDINEAGDACDGTDVYLLEDPDFIAASAAVGCLQRLLWDHPDHVRHVR